LLNNLIRRLVTTALVAIEVLRRALRPRSRLRKLRRLGILNIEYYHERIGTFGGYGMTAKSIAETFNRTGDRFEVSILLNRRVPEMTTQSIRLDGTEVIVYPDGVGPRASAVLDYYRLLRRADLDLLLTIEYYSSYFYSALLQPGTPLVLWIHDPRPDDEWRKIATVPLELEVNRQTLEGILEGRRYEMESLARIRRLARWTGRPLRFATTARCLVDVAKQAYGISDLEPFFLPIPIEVPVERPVAFAPRPSFCFLGRLDPIKRPWIYFEVAKRFPAIDFVVAGKTHFPKAMDPICQKYADLPNLRFLGLIDERRKEELLASTWGLINTSVHEALPVSFEEALSYGKPIISCQDPDGLVSGHGFHTGEILGDGTDESVITRFCQGVEHLTAGRDDWQERGKAAQERIRRDYSFRKFASVLEEVLGQAVAGAQD